MPAGRQGRGRSLLVGQQEGAAAPQARRLVQLSCGVRKRGRAGPSSRNHARTARSRQYPSFCSCAHSYLFIATDPGPVDAKKSSGKQRPQQSGVYEHGPGHKFSISDLDEEGVEGVVATPNSLVAGILPVRLDATSQAAELPAGSANLDISQANVDGDALTLWVQTDE
ncbi:hypothetical protein NDU88_000312 [Pleurodeles waltl]|uniref:Uncharacterized protein n=1 Tax=Pleurodeles waltl TaxID=8319 RepID=A0AAV7KLV4_PLEWA|nr:hypothetical protein NDU88_000312 [Pleurodeles waltl]